MSTLAAMDPEFSARHSDMKSRRKMHTLIDRAARETMLRVFAEADTDKDEIITFQEWVDWYEQHGAAELPWIHALETATKATEQHHAGDGADGGIELTRLDGGDDAADDDAGDSKTGDGQEA